MIHLLAECYDTKSNVKLGGFQSQLQASYVSSHTEELWYNETVSLWMTIYIYIYIYFWKVWVLFLKNHCFETAYWFRDFWLSYHMI